MGPLLSNICHSLQIHSDYQVVRVRFQKLRLWNYIFPCILNVLTALIWNVCTSMLSISGKRVCPGHQVSGQCAGSIWQWPDDPCVWVWCSTSTWMGGLSLLPPQLQLSEPRSVWGPGEDCVSWYKTLTRLYKYSICNVLSLLREDYMMQAYLYWMVRIFVI